MNNKSEMFFKDIIQELKKNNCEDALYMVAPIIQNIDQPEYEKFREQLNRSIKYYFVYYPDLTEGHSNGSMKVTFEFTSAQPKVYLIDFLEETRYTKYCTCSPSDKGYREDKGCCGCCDWIAPSFKITYLLELGLSVWNGNERDFWYFEDNYNIKQAKESQINQLKTEIKNMQRRLAKLEQAS